MRRFFSLSLTLFFLVPFLSLAQSPALVLTVNAPIVGVGQEVVATVALNTGSETLNTIAADVRFDQSVVEFVSASDGGSVVSFWVDRPTLAEPGVVRLSGVIPGGFLGENGRVVRLRFRAIALGEANISLADATLYRNDGSGESVEAPPASAAATVVTEPQPIPSLFEDTTPPDPFTPVIVRDASIYDGQPVLVFSVQDKEDGIDRVEVSVDGGPFVAATSPFLLPSHPTTSVRVRAYDGAGNAREATLDMKKPGGRQFPNLRDQGILGVMIGGIALIGTLWVLIRRRQRP